MRGVAINLATDNLARILDVPLGGWGLYVKFAWPPLDNLPSALEISRKFLGNPNLGHYHRVFKREMYSLHQLYFNVMHKMILPRKEKCIEENFLHLTFMELLDTKFRINFPILMIKHM